MTAPELWADTGKRIGATGASGNRYLKVAGFPQALDEGGVRHCVVHDLQGHLLGSNQ